MPISYNIHARILKELLADESIRIPDHQRALIWKPIQQVTLVDSVMKGYVIPNIIIRETYENGEKIRWLEDGHQRYMSLKKFYNNEFTYNNTLYKDFTENERIHFLTYKIHVTTCENGGIDETLEMFERFQCGTALTTGNRLKANRGMRLVKYAIERFLTRGNSFYQRSVVFWGEHLREDDNVTNTLILNAVSIAGGLAHGVNHISRSYDVLGPIQNKEFDVGMADKYLDMVFKVYEGVVAGNPFTKKEKKYHWDAGKLTAYILASLINDPTEEMIAKWVKYISDSRKKGNTKYTDLHMNMSRARSWNALRWRIGYENIFVNSVVAGEDEGDDEDDDSTIDEV